jgi:hypothetical protein
MLPPIRAVDPTLGGPMAELEATVENHGPLLARLLETASE